MITVARLVLAVALMSLLAACGSTRQVLPVRTADKVGNRVQVVVDRFRICSLDFNRSVPADPITPAAASEFIAGYNNHIRPGQSCDTQESFAYNGLVHFDLGDLRNKVIVEAQVSFTRRESNVPVRVDRVVPSGILHDNECALLVRVATEDWSAGRSSGGIGTEPLPGTPRDGYEANLDQQSGIIGGGIGVTKAVQQWALGRKPNFGFVIMPKPGTLDKNENSCTGVWSNPRLQLTILDRPPASP